MDPRRIHLSSDEPRYEIEAWRGDGVPTVTGGLGGWVAVSRPRRLPITDYQGSEALTMDVPLLFDSFADGTSLENDLSALMRMATIDGARLRPSIIKLTGAVPFADRLWGISGMSFGDAVWDTRGFRTRQELTVTFIEYIQDRQLAQLETARTRTTASSIKRYTVKAGEHLGEIAARQLGDAQRWREIAKLNGLRDPRSVRAGQVLRMPAR